MAERNLYNKDGYSGDYCDIDAYAKKGLERKKQRTVIPAGATARNIPGSGG
jgi:hypothetical protein